MSGRIIHGDATPEAWDNAVPARRPRSWANACNACKGYPDEEHTMDENCLVPTEIGTRRPEDDALDRLRVNRMARAALPAGGEGSADE